MTDSYYTSRYVWNNDRHVVWKEIVRFLSPYISHKKTILDLGSGYCDFINTVSAEKKIAVDYSIDSKQYANKEVVFIQSVATDLSQIPSHSVDVVFSSNLLEHLTDSELDLCMKEVKRVLVSGGLFISMQPNYRYSYKTYFDDPTHKKVFSHTALESFLVSYGFDVIRMMPKFLPFSLKSRPSIIPIHPLIVRLYLHLPIKPFAGQMLFVTQIK